MTHLWEQRSEDPRSEAKTRGIEILGGVDVSGGQYGRVALETVAGMMPAKEEGLYSVLYVS